jgi:hypothetical protein
MVSISAQLAANRFEADFIRVHPSKTLRGRRNACPFTASAIRTHTSRNLLLNPNADGGLSSARLAATPKRLPILPLDARKCNANFYK